MKNGLALALERFVFRMSQDLTIKREKHYDRPCVTHRQRHFPLVLSPQRVSLAKIWWAMVSIENK
jgi:hypothetical protein